MATFGNSEGEIHQIKRDLDHLHRFDNIRDLYLHTTICVQSKIMQKGPPPRHRRMPDYRSKHLPNKCSFIPPLLKQCGVGIAPCFRTPTLSTF